MVAFRQCGPAVLALFTAVFFGVLFTVTDQVPFEAAALNFGYVTALVVLSSWCRWRASTRIQIMWLILAIISVPLFLWWLGPNPMVYVLVSTSICIYGFAVSFSGPASVENRASKDKKINLES